MSTQGDSAASGAQNNDRANEQRANNERADDLAGMAAVDITAVGGVLALPGRNWGWFMARGVLLVILGVLAGLAPGWAVFSFALLFAAFSFADGVLAIASGIRGATHARERWWLLILSGIAGIAVGVLFVLFPLLSTLAYGLFTVMIIAAWAVVTGVLEIAAAIRMRREIEGEWLLALSGVLSVLLGVGLVVLAWIDPGVTVLSVGWLIAIYALIAGIALIVLSLRLRKRAKGD